MGTLQLSLRSGNTVVADIYGGPFTSDLEASRALSGGAEAMETAAEPELVTEGAPLAMVLAAKRELRAGSFLRDSDLELIPLPEDAPEGRYFYQEIGAVEQETGAVEQATSAVEQLRGALVTTTIPAGTPLEADMIIGTTEQGFLTAALAPGMRAVSVAINDVTGLSGFASPGDRVDVLLTYTFLHTEFEQKKRSWSETILQNVRLLSITQRVDPATGMPTVGVGHTATVELYPSQVEVLTLAATYGVVSLSLHGPPSDAEPTFGFSYTSDLGVAAGISDFFDSGRAVGAAENIAPDTPAFTRIANRVLVTERALAKGALLKDSDFRFEVLAGEIPAGAEYFVMGVVKVETLRGALVTTAIGANEIIPADALLTPAEQGFLSAVIKPGMRASSITINQTTGVSGFISPGDVVDVLMTHSVDDVSDNPIYSPRRFAETVVSGARVIAVETVTDPVRNRDDWKTAAAPQWVKTVTLETTAKQAEVLVLACLRDSKNLVDSLEARRANDSPVRLVINHQGAYRKTELTDREFETNVGSTTTLIIAHDPVLFGTAANNGQVIGAMNSSSKVVEGFNALAQLVSGMEPTTVKKKTDADESKPGPFAFLRKKGKG